MPHQRKIRAGTCEDATPIKMKRAGTYEDATPNKKLKSAGTYVDATPKKCEGTIIQPTWQLGLKVKRNIKMMS